MQMTDAETKRIFEARVRVAREPDSLAEPERLTVLAGPHESVRETWYVELLDEHTGGIDRDRLKVLAADRQSESNVLTTRSTDLAVLVEYLVATDGYESTAAALRELAFAGLAEERPALLDAYADVREQRDPDPLERALEGRE